MATYTKLPLSGSVNGKQILVTSTTSGSAVSIHTAHATSLDEIYLYAYNDSTSSLQLSVLWGGTVEPNDVIRASIPSKSGRTLLVDGKLLTNSLIVQSYADQANFISVDGFVNRIT